MARKVRSDIKIGNLEKKLGLDSGAIRNPDGSDARSDKTLKKLRQEYDKQKVKKKSSEPKPTATKKASTIDEQKASKRQVKQNPKTSPSLSKKVRSAIKKSSSK
jgi:hypothetical protein